MSNRYPGQYKVKRYNKYKNKKVKVGDLTFDSIKEYHYFIHLQTEKKQGRIKGFERQVKYILLQKNDKFRAVTYRADFAVHHNDGSKEVIDIKSLMTRKLEGYILRKKMMYAFFGIEIKEI